MPSRRSSAKSFVLGLALFYLIGARTVQAQVTASPSLPTPPTDTSLFDKPNLLPDPTGWRDLLAKRGIVLGVIYTGETFGNPLGGYRQGTVYDGLLTLSLDIDFKELVGWNGLQFHVLAYEIHGASGTNLYTRDLEHYSSIDFYDSFRLFELWVNRSFFEGRLSVRLGQLAVDSEFANSDAAALFINAGLGALPTFALNVPVAQYGIATPGVSFRLNTLSQRFYLQGGVYAGNPDADRLGDPRPGFKPGTQYNDDGLRFPISSPEGAFTIGQFGYRLNRAPDARGLPGTYRFGAFYHSEVFSDERLDFQGRSLASPASTGLPKARPGDYGVFFAGDQTLYRPRGSGPGAGGGDQPASAPVGNSEDTTSQAAAPNPSGPEGSVFLRVGVAPDDRNLVPFYLDTGLNYRALLPGRPMDVFGLAFSHAGLSDARRELVREHNRLTGAHDALPDYETVLELTYQINVCPWWLVQPDLQYIIHPGGSSQNDNALVIGVRSTLTF